jgi:hypothetical protein
LQQSSKSAHLLRPESPYLLESSMPADQDKPASNPSAQDAGQTTAPAARAGESTARQDNAPADNGMDDPRKSPVAGSGNSLGSGKTANNTASKSE